MNHKGWIKLHRKLMNSTIWSDPLRLKAWIHILLSANHEDRDIFLNGSKITVKEGQIITSIRKLQEAWGCSPNTVRRILDQLQELDMLTHEAPHKRYTLLTVINYKLYQGKGYTDEHSDGYSDEYTDEHSDGTQTRSNKNIKNDKEDIYKASPESEDEDDWDWDWSKIPLMAPPKKGT